MRLFIVWLVGIVIWNYGFPLASPFEDVVASALLFFMTVFLKRYSIFE